MTGRDISTTHLAEASSRDGEGRLGGDGRLPAIGSVIAGKYRIEGLLGRGGMGVVALGRQLELDRPVAIKFLRDPLASDPRPLQRFAREARIIARMRSEHVVRVFDVGREHDLPFIVMERLSGHDLAKEIERAPLGVERAVELVLHACEALGEAHSLGIVHRDVKPSNLFVAEGFGGRQLLKVLDFGVSKWLARAHDGDTSALSTDGGAVGTPAFASPEQLTHPELIDGRTDVWALGVVLYQALSGELPFAADTIPALYSRIIGGEAAPFPAGRGVPPELVAVVDRCLKRDPNERYASMLELARALVPFAPPRAHAVVDSLATLAAREDAEEIVAEAEKAGAQLETTLEFSQNTPPVRETTAAATKPRRALVAGAGVAAVAGVAVLVAAWPRGNEHAGADAGVTDGAVTGSALTAAEPASATEPHLEGTANGAATTPPSEATQANGASSPTSGTASANVAGSVANSRASASPGAAGSTPGVRGVAPSRHPTPNKNTLSAAGTPSSAPLPSAAAAASAAAAHSAGATAHPSASAAHANDTIPLYRR